MTAVVEARRALPPSKENSYCRTSPTLELVLKEIQKSGINVNGMEFTHISGYCWGRSTVCNLISYAGSPRWFENESYHEVDAHEFSIIWLGYDCLTKEKKASKDSTDSDRIEFSITTIKTKCPTIIL